MEKHAAAIEILLPDVIFSIKSSFTIFVVLLKTSISASLPYQSECEIICHRNNRCTHYIINTLGAPDFDRIFYKYIATSKSYPLFSRTTFCFRGAPYPLSRVPPPLAPPLRIAVGQMMGYQAPWAARRGLQPGGAPGLRPLRIGEYVRTGTGGLPACAPTASQWSVGLPPYKSAVPRPLGCVWLLTWSSGRPGCSGPWRPRCTGLR